MAAADRQVVLLFPRRESSTHELLLSKLLQNHETSDLTSFGQDGENIADMLERVISPSLALQFGARHSRVTVDISLVTTHFSYFRSMFELGMKESQSDSVEVHDVAVIDFLHLLYHCISDNITCNICLSDGDLLCNMIDAAAYLSDTASHKAAMDSVVNRVCPECCLGLLVRAHQYSHQKLFSEALKCALFYADTVLEQKDELARYLNSPHHPIIHFYLTHSMFNSDRLQSDQLAILSKLLGTPACTIVQQAPRDCLAVHVTNHRIELHRVAEIEEEVGCKVMLGKSIPLGSTNGLSLIGHSVCTFNEFVYVSGGELGLGKGKWNTRIFEINTVHHQHPRLGMVSYQMPERRRHHKSCCSHKTLYIAGGHDRYRCKRYEVFKISVQHGPDRTAKEKWQRLADVPDTVDALRVTRDDKLLAALCVGEVWVLCLDQPQPAADWLPASDEQRASLHWAAPYVHTTEHVVWYPEFQLPKLPV